MVNIIFEEDKNRSVAYDEEAEIGKATITKLDKTWSIDHVWVEVKYRGNRIAERLVAIIVEEARKQDKQITPICSYAVKEFREKTEYNDVLKK